MEVRPRFIFVAERQVGIGSVAAALQTCVREAASELDAAWCDVTYSEPDGLLERLSFVPERMRGTLRGFLQTGDALRRGPFDAGFFLTHNPAVFRQHTLSKMPTCLWTDVTPIQLDDMARAYEHPVPASRLVRAAGKIIVRRAFRLARFCLGWSEWARRSFVNDYGIPEERTAVVPPGVALSQWDPTPRPIRPDRPLRLAFVGGQFQRKGGNLLLDVFRQRLAGRVELLIATRDPIAEQPGIRVFRDLNAGDAGLQRLLREADAFVLPTLADCHSIATLEAMASGLPVILTRVGAGSEIVQDGATGFLVAPGDGAGLAHAIEALAADRARARDMGQRGRSLAEQNFDVRLTARRIITIMKRVAADRGVVQ